MRAAGRRFDPQSYEPEGWLEWHLPRRCRAEEAAAQLLLVLEGLPFLADRPWEEVGWGRMWIELLTLWRLELLLVPDPDAGGRETRLERIVRCDAPDGRCWEYGCQRDDWTLGPDSRLVDPLTFLLEPQKRALMERLRRASCWPAPPAVESMGALLLLPERIRRRRPARRAGRHSRDRNPKELPYGFSA